MRKKIIFIGIIVLLIVGFSGEAQARRGLRVFWEVCDEIERSYVKEIPDSVFVIKKEIMSFFRQNPDMSDSIYYAQIKRLVRALGDPDYSYFLDPDETEEEIRCGEELASEIHVDYELRDGVAIIKIYNFDPGAGEEFRKIVDSILVFNPKALIIDLRGNPGGCDDELLEIVGFWHKGLVAVDSTKQGIFPLENTGPGKTPLKRFKTMILADGLTASSAERFIGVFQDMKLAKVVGTRTYGKGTAQQDFWLDEDCFLSLTVIIWKTAGGRAVNKKGLKPDIIVKEGDSLEKALEILKK